MPFYRLYVQFSTKASQKVSTGQHPMMRGASTGLPAKTFVPGIAPLPPLISDPPGKVGVIRIILTTDIRSIAKYTARPAHLECGRAATVTCRSGQSIT